MAYAKVRGLVLAAALSACTFVPAPAAHAGSGDDVIAYINAARAQHGLRALQSSDDLHRFASRHCRRMLRTNSFAHSSSTPPHRRMSGETIAWMPSASARRVVRAWLNSPPHRAVLLSPQLKRVGVGKRRGKLDGRRGVTWTADFSG